MGRQQKLSPRFAIALAPLFLPFAFFLSSPRDLLFLYPYHHPKNSTSHPHLFCDDKDDK
jgi:hypothetical protein